EGLNDLRPFVFLRLHPLKGDQRGRWAVDVSGNWRITFSVNADGEFDELDYEDYH
ncbi:MAG: type II toxin-antitoxin system RelE/ParE family toxin, partial [Candidatus Rokuibacteriota bacterium]